MTRIAPILPVALLLVAGGCDRDQSPETQNQPITIDLPSLTIAWPGVDPLGFPVDPFARRCLLEGIDELGYLLALEPEIAAHERR